jgi:hypothetical protein
MILGAGPKILIAQTKTIQKLTFAYVCANKTFAIPALIKRIIANLIYQRGN